MKMPALFVATLLAASAAAATAPQDGLEPIKVRGIDQAWQRPGTSLATYSGVVLKPVAVQFSANWNPRSYGTFGLKTGEIEKIRSEMAELAGESFERVLSKKGHAIASAPGANVLDLQLEVVDLYVNAPETELKSSNRTYVRSAGQMRLLVTLRDSATGAILYRSSDLDRGDEAPRLELATTAYNRTEFERVFTTWAQQLEKKLAARN